MKTTRIFFTFAMMVIGMAAGCTVGVESESAPYDEAMIREETAPRPASATPIREDSCGECIRAILCVEVCGGNIMQSGCCACPSGTFDSAVCVESDI